MFIDNLLQFIFPNRCVICDTVLSYGDKLENKFLCKECRSKIEFIKEPTCKKCGAMIGYDDEAYCTRCKMKMPKYFDYGFGLCRYNDFVKESLHRIKYNGRKEYIEFYAKMIAKIYHDKIKNINPDYLVPVPIHKSRLLKRTYNQSSILAYKLSEALKEYGMDIPVNENIIFRVKNTKVLNKLDESSRSSELNNAFNVLPVDGINSILILDDIFTTGSTLETIAKDLKTAGIREVYFACIAVVDNL